MGAGGGGEGGGGGGGYGGSEVAGGGGGGGTVPNAQAAMDRSIPANTPSAGTARVQCEMRINVRITSWVRAFTARTCLLALAR